MGDLGSKALCDQAYGHYTTVGFNLTTIQSDALVQGICLPAECSQADMDTVTTTVTTFLNDFLIKELNITDVSGKGQLQPDSRLQVNFLYEAEVVNGWE